MSEAVKTVRRDEEYEKLMARINKQFGEGTIMRLGDRRAGTFRIETIPTQSLKLNQIIGRGGVPRGRFTYIFGPEASGKTSVALGVVAEAQKKGEKAAWIDAETAFDAEYAAQLGVDVNDLYLVQPEDGETAMDVAEALVASGLFGVVVVDSLAALVPRAELEGTMSDQQMALQARLIGKALRKLNSVVRKSNCAFIYINQIRDSMSPHGPREVVPGGRAPKFWATLSIEVRKTDWVRDGDEIIGHRVRYKTVKNRLAPPQKVTEVEIIYGKGIDHVQEVVDVCIEEGIITRAGAWYTLRKEDGTPMLRNGKEIKWNGMKAIVEEARSNERFFEYLRDRFYAKVTASNDAVAEAPEEEAEPTEETPPTEVEETAALEVGEAVRTENEQGEDLFSLGD
ncbi:MAG TPA: recombinase RecA [Symbiobacteriaceae bacterium]